MLNSRQFTALVAIAATIWLPSPTSGNVLPHKARQTDFKWVDTWTSMPQLVEPDNLPAAPFKTSSAILNDATIRQTLHMSLGADQIRIQISNTFGTTALPITSIAISLPAGGKAGSSSIQPTTIRGVTFNGGSESISIPAGKTAYTDSIDYTVAAQSMLTVTMYLKTGQQGNSITGHPGSRTTSWMQAGSDVNMTGVTGGSTKHWYFVSGVEAWVPSNSSAFVILGDSITDGRGSDDDANNRWPDLVLAKMQKTTTTSTIAVVNQAAGGNRVLNDGLGPSLFSRYTRDAITQAGVKYIMIFEGVNDIGTAATDSASQTAVGDKLIAAFKQIAGDARKAGIRVFGATITPLGTSYGNAGREATRQRVNKWILASGGVYDAVVDFDGILRDPNNAANLASKYNSGDGLHPNDAGYAALAAAFPLDIFQ